MKKWVLRLSVATFVVLLINCSSETKKIDREPAEASPTHDAAVKWNFRDSKTRSWSYNSFGDMVKCGFLGSSDCNNLTDEELKAYATAHFPGSAVKSAVILFDNEDALNVKANFIESAKSSIDMVYYILGEDHTSSLLLNKVIAKANAGVKVRILVDFFTNAGHYDLFAALDSHKNIEIKFFNAPDETLLESALFAGAKCSGLELPGNPGAAEKNKSCRAEKDRFTRSIFTPALKDRFKAAQKDIRQLQGLRAELYKTIMQQAPYVKDLFAGIYTKTMPLIEQGLINVPIDLAAMKESSSGAKVTAEDKAQLAELMSLIYDAKIEKDATAMLKLRMAMLLYPEQVLPIYTLVTAILPVDLENNLGNSSMHLTDFTHHKLLLVDNERFVLGGRNVEDAYHSSSFDLTSKYLFFDTDVAVITNSKGGAAEIGRAYGKLFNFTPLTSSIQEVAGIANLSKVATRTPAQVAAALAAADICEFPGGSSSKSASALSGKKGTNKQKCSRDAAIPFEMGGRIEIPASDLSKTDFYYMENLPYSKNSYRRIFGVTDGKEYESGKYMHQSLIRGIQKTCAESKSEGPQKITFFQGYTLLPANFVNMLGQMYVNAPNWSCGELDIDIITNSIETTDLNIINILTLHQMQAIYQFQNNLQEFRDERANGLTVNKNVQLNYYEFALPQGAADKKRSLHSKINIIGKDVMIGSMNLDIRSYFMDTNNGLYIRGADEMRNQLQQKIADVTNGHLDLKLHKQLKTLSRDQMRAMTNAAVDKMANYWINKRKDPQARAATLAKYKDFEPKLKAFVTRITNLVYKQTLQVLEGADAGGSTKDLAAEARVVQDSFNKLLMVF